MARPKKIGTRRHLHIDPYIWLGENADRDALVAWYDSQPAGQRTELAVGLLCAAITGKLGPQVQSAVRSGNTAEALEALGDLMEAFG